MFKKIALVTAVMLAVSACGSSKKDDDNHVSTAVSPTVVKATAVGTTPVSVSVNAIEKQKRAELREQDIPTGGASYILRVNGKAYKQGENVNLLEHLPANGVGDVNIAHEFNGNTNINVHKNNIQITENQVLRGYRQNYSVVAGVQTTGLHNHNLPAVGHSDERSEMEIDIVKGHATPEMSLPKTGTYQYSGAAFTPTETGRLNYSVNFDKRYGSGNIVGLPRTGDVVLKQAPIGTFGHVNGSLDGTSVMGAGIEGKATFNNGNSSDYKLGFFGNNAEEISGIVQHENGNIGFGGKR